MPDAVGRTRSPDELYDAYCGVRTRVRAAVESTSAAALDARCPATPAWRVHDVLAHLVGVPNDVLAGRIEGVATDPWTQAQVDARRDTSAADMLDAWDADGVAMEPLFAVVGFERFGQMLFDALTHENDLCHALGVAADRENLGVDCAFDWLVAVAGAFRGDPLRVRTGRDDVVIGPGEPVATIDLTRFEFVRASSGRRSRAQVTAYPNEGLREPDMILTAPLFTLATVDIVE